MYDKYLTIKEEDLIEALAKYMGIPEDNIIEHSIQVYVGQPDFSQPYIKRIYLSAGFIDPSKEHLIE